MVVRVAVVGDIHGRMDAMYQKALDWQDEHQQSLDALLQVGDFEAIRDERDYAHYYAPERRHRPSDFPSYFDGTKRAPILTVFTGGNHEPWGHLGEHAEGGFLSPNVYYLGRAGSLVINGITIAGLTGLFSPKHYRSELPAEPCDEWKYYREKDIARLEGINPDVLLLHDWIRPYSAVAVEEEVGVPSSFKKNAVVSPTFPLIQRTSPQFVFMGHLDAYLRGKIRNTGVTGLRSFCDNPADDYAFTVVEVPTAPAHPESAHPAH